MVFLQLHSYLVPIPRVPFALCVWKCSFTIKHEPWALLLCFYGWISPNFYKISSRMMFPHCPFSSFCSFSNCFRCFLWLMPIIWPFWNRLTCFLQPQCASLDGCLTSEKPLIVQKPCCQLKHNPSCSNYQMRAGVSVWNSNRLDIQKKSTWSTLVVIAPFYTSLELDIHKIY